MKLLVGLGNPGTRYQDTRHNMGFRVVDLLANKANVAVTRYHARSLMAKFTWAGNTVLLAKPQTYMNNSGAAVRCLIDYYRIASHDLLVLYDDLDLPPGRLRMRPKGSTGGHNGVRSIIDYLRTDLFARLRIGIGPVPEGMDGAEYVLSPFTAEEAPLIERACLAAVDASLLWIEFGIEKAAARVNAPVGGDTMK